MEETKDCSEVEQLSICVRYVNNDAEVCKDFLGFLKLEKMDAQSIIDVIIPSLQIWGLDFSLLVAQGYDGASVMSPNITGIQVKVHALFPVSTASHMFYLILQHPTVPLDVSSIRNLFSNIT